MKIMTAALVCLTTLLSFTTTTLLAPFQAQKDVILYVREGGTSETCTGWDDACDLQTALALADAPDEVWVAAGTYYPTANNDRNISFVMETGVAIYGGFAGNETALSQRDWDANPVTLSGDIGEAANNADNSLHVVIASVENAVLDGFTITGGNATDWSVFWGEYGGGMLILGGSPTLTNLTIDHNSAEDGGGMANLSGQPAVTNVDFIYNIANSSGGGMYNNNANPELVNVNFFINYAIYGGGMYNTLGAPLLNNALFNYNHAWHGGGMKNNNTDPILKNVTFWDNSAEYDGGGLHNSLSNLALENCTFFSNAALNSGGGVYSEISSSLTLTNVTLSSNTAYNENGGALYSDSSSSLNLVNAIVWGNSPNGIYGGTSTVNYSTVQGGYPGTGNLSTDPVLLPIADNGGFAETQALNTGSPAIDAGSPDICQVIDQRGYIRPIDGDGVGGERCDMGSYEFNSTPVEYFLSINTTGNGTVTPSPDQEVYHYGDVITLSASADPGWSFAGWSGDAVGTLNPLMLIILDDQSIMGTFTQDEYNVTVIVNPEGSGLVTISPEQETYHYGDEITVTATAGSNWIFAGRSGDITGSDNPQTLTIQGNTQINANFARMLHLPLILR